MNIKVVRGRLREKYAQVERHGNGRYTITLNHNNAPLENATALLHEFLHIIFWEYMPFENIEREHRFTAAMEKSFKRHKRTYWEGDT